MTTSRDTGTQHKLRMPPELKEKLFSSAKGMNRSLNAEIVARLEKSFEIDSDQDQTQLMQTAMIQIIMAATKAFGKKGLEWSEIQENLVDATTELAKNINKKAP